MFFLIFLLLVQSVSTAAADCSLTVTVTYSSTGPVCLGENFNLTCSFYCLSAGNSIQMLKNQKLFTESSASSATNSTLTLLIHNATERDSGDYLCQTASTSEYAKCSHTLNITACPPGFSTVATPSDSPSASCPPGFPSVAMPSDSPSAWSLQNTLMWYLLCKTGVFLMCSMSAVLKFTCKTR